MHLTADAFLVRLHALQSDAEREKYRRYFKFGEGEYAHGDSFIGVRMGHVFALAKEFVALPPAEIERLLDSDIHEARAGAMSVMARQFALKKTSTDRRQELYELYLRRHDRINNWDLVDLAAWHVVGPWLLDKPRDVLYRLAKSDSLWERRTAILATFAFIRRGQLDDTYAIAELLLDDPEDLIHKATGWMLRTTDSNRPALNDFLEKHATKMPRVMLRNALEHYKPEERKRYLGMRE